MSEFIPLSVPSIKGNEWQYVKECLDTEWVSSAGKYVDNFESKICEFTGSKFAIGCVNGTSALHIALKLIGVSAGDEVIVPTLTFIAPINVVRYLGAEPIFMDCDQFYNIDLDKVLEFLEQQTTVKNGALLNKQSGRRIAAIMPVHVFGNAVNMEKLLKISEQFNIKIIEDASESLGTRYRDICSSKHTGTVGQIGCFSFNGNKIITTGGGGIIVTDSEDYAEKARYLTTQAKDNEIYFVHDEVGYNYRLTNIQAAMGVAQLERLTEYLEIKKKNFNLYRLALEEIPGLDFAMPPSYADNNLWMYPLQIDKDKYGIDRDALMKNLSSKGIQTRPVWHLNHKQSPYLNCQHYKIERAERLLEITLNIPCSVNLTSAQQAKVIEALRQR